MEDKFGKIISNINKFKTEIIVLILLFFLVFSLIVGLQVIFISCLVILILIVFKDFLLNALLYFKSIEAGTHGFKFTLNPEEIKKAIAKSKFSDKAKKELEKPKNINAFQETLEEAYRLKLSDLLKRQSSASWIEVLSGLLEKEKSKKE